MRTNNGCNHNNDALTSIAEYLLGVVMGCIFAYIIYSGV